MDPMVVYVPRCVQNGPESLGLTLTTRMNIRILFQATNGPGLIIILEIRLKYQIKLEIHRHEQQQIRNTFGRKDCKICDC
jgi:hypothetical protein